MYLAGGEDGAAGATRAFVEADHAGGGVLFKGARHVLLDAAGHRGEFGDRLRAAFGEANRF
jgi:hypothetical protein